MLINPVVAYLHNTKLNTWHPIVFQEHPVPGNPKGVVRHRSVGHHTDGFATRELAEASVATDLMPEIAGLKTAKDPVITWDGEDTPAMQVFFPEFQNA